MFILEIMLAICLGTITYVICYTTGNQALAILTKLVTVLICLEIMVKTIVPVLHSVRNQTEEIRQKVYSVEQKVDRYEKKIERFEQSTEGIFDFVRPHLNN